MEKEQIETFEQLKDFIVNAFSIIKGDFMDFIYTFPEETQGARQAQERFLYSVLWCRKGNSPPLPLLLSKH